MVDFPNSEGPFIGNGFEGLGIENMLDKPRFFVIFLTATVTARMVKFV